MGGTCCELSGMTEAERWRRNAVAYTLARSWDQTALRYLRHRSGEYGTGTFPPGLPYEPEGGPVAGWATASARDDARSKHAAAVRYLANEAPDPLPSAPPPPPGTTTLPEVTVLGTPDEVGGVLPLAGLAMAGLFLLGGSRR